MYFKLLFSLSCLLYPNHSIPPLVCSLVSIHSCMGVYISLIVSFTLPRDFAVLLGSLKKMCTAPAQVLVTTEPLEIKAPSISSELNSGGSEGDLSRIPSTIATSIGNSSAITSGLQARPISRTHSASPSSPQFSEMDGSLGGEKLDLQHRTLTAAGQRDAFRSPIPLSGKAKHSGEFAIICIGFRIRATHADDHCFKTLS